jgi:hypothetical protein
MYCCPDALLLKTNRDILEGNPEVIIGNPVSVLDTMHKNDVKDGNHYFEVDEDDWDDVSEQEEPLTWSLDEPGNLCDWTVEVTRIHSPSFPTAGMARFPGKDKHPQNKHVKEQRERPLVQNYHVHKAILSAG